MSLVILLIWLVGPGVFLCWVHSEGNAEIKNIKLKHKEMTCFKPVGNHVATG